MSLVRRASWEKRHRDAAPGPPEPCLLELLPVIPPGLALDIAAGTGRNAIALARAGFRVVAADYSVAAMRTVGRLAALEHLPIFPLITDLEESFPFRHAVFDLVVNISYLDRRLVPQLKRALRIGGVLLFDTFTIAQLPLGHPHDPKFMLQHDELRAILADMEMLHYREGLTTYASGRQAWRATALARRIA
ncbi:MAG TPA: methyltransferase domain-containing protein [Candidatus Binataceae bacterium]|nr:methyltransferase domain-containing protein [Candidatus Binataceae bacterium]